MQFNYYLKRKAPLAVLFGLLLGLVSCGSYQYVGVDNDGIYGNGIVQTQERVVEVPVENTNNFYKNYFENDSFELYELKCLKRLFNFIKSLK